MTEHELAGQLKQQSLSEELKMVLDKGKQILTNSDKLLKSDVLSSFSLGLTQVEIEMRDAQEKQ